MIRELPNTSIKTVSSTLLEMRAAAGVVAVGRVLTLVIATPAETVEQAILAAKRVSGEHPCRVIMISLEPEAEPVRVDGAIRVGQDAGAGEVITLRAYGEVANHPHALVSPLLLPDAPTVVWWPAQPPTDPGADQLGQDAQRRITDLAAAADGGCTLLDLAANYSPGDTDFAWSRITLWRRMLATALDNGPESVDRIVVQADPASPSGDLLAAWLNACLGAPLERVAGPAGSGICGVQLHYGDQCLSLTRDPGSDVAVMQRTGGPARELALPHRDEAACLAEELRRLDDDPAYHRALLRAAELKRAAGGAG